MYHTILSRLDLHTNQYITTSVIYKCNNQVNLLMISNGKKWHYLAVRSLSALLRGITSNLNGDFYCLNCFPSYRSYNKLRRHEKVCHKHDYCHVGIPKEEEI